MKELTGIITWDNSLEPTEEAKTYTNFSYEYDPSETSGSNGLLEQVKNKNAEVSDAIDEISSNFNTLKTKYDVFTDFDDLIDTNLNNLRNTKDEIRQLIESLTTESIGQVRQAMEADEAMARELEALGWNK